MFRNCADVVDAADAAYAHMQIARQQQTPWMSPCYEDWSVAALLTSLAHLCDDLLSDSRAQYISDLAIFWQWNLLPCGKYLRIWSAYYQNTWTFCPNREQRSRRKTLFVRNFQLWIRIWRTLEQPAAVASFQSKRSALLSPVPSLHHPAHLTRVPRLCVYVCACVCAHCASGTWTTLAWLTSIRSLFNHYSTWRTCKLLVTCIWNWSLKWPVFVQARI